MEPHLQQERKRFQSEESREREKIVEWVKAHPDVVASPLRRDTILCPAPTAEDPTRTVKKNKLLLQTSVRELHADLFKAGVGLPEIVLKDGKKQISDTVFRRILPFELRKMSKHLKEMCCCKICESMNFKQDALNQWRRKKKKQLELKLEALQNAQTRTQRDARKGQHPATVTPVPLPHFFGDWHFRGF